MIRTGAATSQALTGPIVDSYTFAELVDNATGVVSLDYTFRETRRRDAFGNEFRFVSHAEMRDRRGRVRPWITYDVIFVDAPPQP